MTRSAPRHLFAYGTLQPRFVPAEVACFLRNTHAVGAATVRGTLYDLGQYPGLVRDGVGGRKVSGTMLELPPPPQDQALLHELDRYEGPEFRRARCVAWQGQQRVTCWAYVLRHPPSPGTHPISTGRWEPILAARGRRD
ncbi:MAG TPA: gamma-glutamylcyclotransferase family protein [Gemmatimonadales bacterium]|nr:gamma-glutamylcyclotransferase family protein [Gemmatimonadales bacterium]